MQRGDRGEMQGSSLGATVTEEEGPSGGSGCSKARGTVIEVVRARWEESPPSSLPPFAGLAAGLSWSQGYKA